jgi:hypothetical protein
MKKIAIALIAAMMLTNSTGVFAASRTSNNKHNVTSSSQIKLQTQDPDGW